MLQDCMTKMLLGCSSLPHNFAPPYGSAGLITSDSLITGWHQNEAGRGWTIESWISQIGSAVGRTVMCLAA